MVGQKSFDLGPPLHLSKRRIQSPEDARILQEDLDKLQEMGERLANVVQRQ